MVLQSQERTQPAQSSGIERGLARGLTVLDDAALDAVHAATLEVLECTGLEIEHPEMLDILTREGAQVDGARVRFPARLVERGISSAPAQVTLHARDPRQNVYLGRGRVHFTNGFGATWVEDPKTRQVRAATLTDLAAFTRLADALERVDYCLFSVVPQDIPPSLLDLECTAVTLENTGKHIQLSLETADWLDEIFQLGEVVVGKGEPLPFSAGGVPNSPLHYPWNTVEKFVRLARREVPCFVVCGAMAGATSPVSLAGTLVQQNAEVLAGVLITQLAQPGAPVIYGTFAGGFDMRATKLALGGPEITLITAASQQLSNRYGIPLGYATGGVSDSALLDYQTGMEKVASVLFAACAGVDVIHDAVSGLFSAGMLASQAGMVMDSDLCDMVAYQLRGIPSDPESLARDVIDAVGPGGTYLDQLHTAEHFRQTLAMFPLRDRNVSLPNAVTGKSEYVERAARKAAQIQSTHTPFPLDSDQLAALQEIRSQARTKIQ